MDRARGAAPAIRRAGSVALITALLGMAGCTSSSSSPGAGSSPGPASASPGLSVPGTHKATGLTGASVSLTTRVGGISASFTVAPTAVRASANVGAITVHVPGTTSYTVTADARVGKTIVRARQSASSSHVITATTDVGAIVVAPSP
jgi:hypothetical protein